MKKKQKGCFKNFKVLKVFKYQIPVIVLLRKYKENGGIKISPIYFNFTTKTVIDFKLIHF